MDVRCDRCQTEYELDDASVTVEGATVQCTNCGHTFIVTRPAPAATPAPFIGGGTPAPMAGGASQPSASWMLTTEEGKTHRFRDASTLHKWIVERRVTRGDRVCPPGGAWRRLGDLEELRPFFEVVDQADRAAAPARVRTTRPETPRGTRPAAPPPAAYASPDPDDDDVFTGGKGRSKVDVLVDDDDLAAAGLGNPRKGRTLLIGAVVVLAGVAGYLGFRRGPGNPPPGAAPPVAAMPPAPPAPAPPPVAPAPAPAPPAPAPAAASRPAAMAASAPTAAAEPARSGSREAAHETSHETSHDSSSDARPRSYERLVADGDRALENGQTPKAQKLFDEALRLQPNGVAAMSGSAYVLLDRQKPLAAIDTFKRALNKSPGYAPALFGLGEAYRLQGQPGQAIAAYKHYLESSPSGEDAPAARRQIRELESQVPAHAANSAPGGTEPPPAQ